MNKPIDNKNLKIIENKENSATYYTNSVGMIPNYFDFQFVFANQALDGDKVVRNEMCKIFMSPQHAKVFNEMLTQNVKKYEERFGEINVPEEIHLSMDAVK